MKTKLAVLLAALLAAGGSLFAQLSPAPSSTGNITTNAANCNTTNVCVVLHMATSNLSFSETQSGTWTGTLTVEQSGDNQATWSTATTTTANTLYTSALLPGITDARVRSSAAMTGTAVVTITASGPATIQNNIGGSGSGSPSSAAPVMGYYLSSACKDAGITNAFCFNTPANTQEWNGCNWTSASPTVNCFSFVGIITGSITTNVATFTATSSPSNAPVVPSNWAIGNSLVVSGFTGGDTFFNQTCTISAVTTTSVSCPLVHANASSSSNGNMHNSTVAGPFVSADTGKRAWGYQSCRTSFDLAAGNNNQPITTGTALSITFVNSTTVTLSGNAANTAPNESCLIWGTPDDTGAAAMDVAMAAAGQCPRAHLAAGYYMFTTPHFAAYYPSCASLGVLYPNGVNAGNIVYSAGFELDGRGAGTTIMFIPPGFPETGLCTNGKSGAGCFVIPTGGRWSNLQITGGGNRVATVPGGNPNPMNLIEVDGPASLDNFVCTNWGQNTTGGTVLVRGVTAYLWAQLYQVNLSACGRGELVTNVSSSVTAIKLWVENIGDYEGIGFGEATDYYSQSVPLFSKYNFICYDCSVNQEGIATGSPVFLLVNRGGSKVKWYRGALATQGGPTVNNNFGYDCVTTAGCVFDVEDASLDLSTPAGDTGNIAINCTVACTNYIKNSVVKGSATGGFAYKEVAGSVLYDLQGNTIGATSIVGSLIADGHSVKGACTGVATASQTLGLYGTGPNETLTTCTSTTIGSGVPVSGVRTLQNLVVTATAAGTNASSGVVTVLKNGVATTITCTIGTGTACTDGTHSVSLVDGDLISIQFTTQAADTLAGVKAIVEWN